MGISYAKIRPGKLLYLFWHAPTALLRNAYHQGAVNLFLASRARAAMERAADRLPPASAPPAEAPAISFLTGDKFWYQTAFCAHSFLAHAGSPVRVTIIDDGTLQSRQKARFSHLFPCSRLISSDEVAERLDSFLPRSRYPALRAHRLRYPHLRKLTDIHVGESGWKLVLDSDMLFHRRPDEILNWLRSPTQPIHMVDVASSYGYPLPLMAELAGAPIPARLNVGVCGLQSDAIDWDKLEHWCRTLLDREGSHYLLEQALVAMLAAGHPYLSLPPETHIVRPTREESRSPTAVLHHYVAEAKAWYFRFAWQTVPLAMKVEKL